MRDRPRRNDSRVTVARYQVDRLARDPEHSPGGESPAPPPEDETNTAGQTTMEERALFVETTIQQAIRRGDFDGLPGAGKPLEGLDRVHDPDWWIRRKIEREQLTGLGPPALTLRTENAQLDARLDTTRSESRAREIVDDFNRRVIEARRQLQGGPPVVTSPRDVDVEVDRWIERREARDRAAVEQRARRDAELAAMSRRERRRAKRRD